MPYFLKNIPFSMKTGYNNLSYFENLQITTYGGNDMKGHMNTDLGQITIDSDVIAAYAGSVAMEVFGIVGMAAISVKDGVFKLLIKASINGRIAVVGCSTTI